jgi:hypothetical protein
MLNDVACDHVVEPLIPDDRFQWARASPYVINSHKAVDAMIFRSGETLTKRFSISIIGVATLWRSDDRVVGGTEL